MRTDQAKFLYLLFFPVVLCLFNCYGKNTSYEADPNGLLYSSTQGGAGTSSSLGALTINIHSSAYNSMYKHFTLTIDGIGGYTMAGETIQFNNADMKPGVYTFQLNVVCNNGNSADCHQSFVKGRFTVNASYTSIVDVWI